ncbi:MAG: hypothetical protein ACYS9C_04820 [Planctomycetota bacterium]|jgi:hypothetical protein
MSNLLLQEVEYKIQETNFGVWHRYMYINGTSFHEFKSHKSLFGLPLVHYTYGRCPETGRRVIAKGIIAVGRLACGIVAIGHASLGLLAIGQLAIGIVFGLGQLSTGLTAVGQAAISLYFGLGQFATGYIAIGQFAIGKYVLAQVGIGEFVLSMKRADPEAIEFFKALPVIRYFIP